MANPKHIPSIDRLCLRPSVAMLEARHGRRAVVDALRAEAALLRQAFAAGESVTDPGSTIEQAAAVRLQQQSSFSLRFVINATGVIIHTNLGRAPLSTAAAARVSMVSRGYSNLEYDLEHGTRGRRDLHAERLICRLTGAEAACVVNNNAAATLLTLAALGAGCEAIVSRGELVEIGGGFRVPEVMAQSGAVLREVGTTNRTRASDYAAAINERTALILRVHPSNFRIEGFTERPSVRELAALAHRFNLVLVDDLGSGYLGAVMPPDRSRRLTHPSLRDEPDVRSTLAEGANVVMFSGDKLLGGPQAGIIAGSRDPIEKIRRHPLMRALRVDKMTYAALESTLQAYASDRLHEIPVLSMIAASVDEIGARGALLATSLGDAALSALVVDGMSTIGGGSAPGATLPTRLLRLRHATLSANALEKWLRGLDPPVIARIEEGHVVLDLRTVLPEQDDLLRDLLTRAVE